MIQITKSQLLSLMLLYEIGSTTLFALGIRAKQDAWIAVLFATLISLGLLWIYTEIQKQYPGKDFVDILQSLLGKWLATPLILLYALYFFSDASFNFYEFGEIIRTSFLTDTPQFAILGVFIFTVVYMVILGVEVIARTAEILMPVLIIFLLSTYLVASMSGSLEIKELFPVLGNGIQPILKEVLPVINFPFGESIVFLMYWHFMDKKESVRKISLLVIGITGVLLMLSDIIIIMILGAELAAKSEIPLLRVLFDINIADILTNLDIIGVTIMFIGGFYKTVLNFYGAVLVVTTLFKSANQKWVAIVMGISLMVYSMIYFRNITFQRWIGGEVWLPYIVTIFQAIPILILIMIWLKSKTRNQLTR
ncbi:GerAB/ArcD/ProY family transporter [Priestia abyssalis]|uniref:GerAB/ArcD/ProY family transporter n=1 Tax=Priestia abyssalis TaxID=1221450 RepID=UPI0009956F45|nr:GerAB/ArcD/ProY family transporter [Priestia abyssalis]